MESITAVDLHKRERGLVSTLEEWKVPANTTSFSKTSLKQLKTPELS